MKYTVGSTPVLLKHKISSFFSYIQWKIFALDSIFIYCGLLTLQVLQTAQQMILLNVLHLTAWALPNEITKASDKKSYG